MSVPLRHSKDDEHKGSHAVSGHQKPTLPYRTPPTHLLEIETLISRR